MKVGDEIAVHEGYSKKYRAMERYVELENIGRTVDDARVFIRLYSMSDQKDDISQETIMMVNMNPKHERLQ